MHKSQIFIEMILYLLLGRSKDVQVIHLDYLEYRACMLTSTRHQGNSNSS